MAFGFTKKPRGEMLKYTRPGTIVEYTPTGTATYGPNEIRMGRDVVWNRFLGMVFGDGGTASIPAGINPHWVDPDSPLTLLAIGQAPVGVIWLRCGDIEIEGVGGHKLHIIELPAGSAMDNTLELFPNSENIPDDCHVMLVKYYNQANISFGEEGDAMVELNTFMVGDWN